MACYTDKSNCVFINLLTELNKMIYDLHSFGDSYC